ncbi:MAG TPA: zf-HC2 domain-containing protein, partial [Acidobacteriaceae bacterium]|nr:zf-HC2 domain-containing protein [Acidobacteriaceae bacterium]
MTDHLSSATLNALIDQELSAEQAAAAKEHLDRCPACTSSALNHALLKTAVAKAGQRYTASTHLQERLRRLSAGDTQTPPSRSAKPPQSRSPQSRSAWWIVASTLTAAAVVLIAASWMLVQRESQHAQLTSQIASVERAALVNEVLDQHIATLAANQPPQVISSDRHTVKPWFQGKLPFSFNLPDNLPDDTKLDGANLIYLRNRPAAQLLYSVGRHRVSVLIGQKQNAQKQDALISNPATTERSGFHVTGFATDDLEVVAISDVDPARLSGLVHTIEQAQ